MQLSVLTRLKAIFVEVVISAPVDAAATVSIAICRARIPVLLRGKNQGSGAFCKVQIWTLLNRPDPSSFLTPRVFVLCQDCLLYTSDAADE